METSTPARSRRSSERKKLEEQRDTRSCSQAQGGRPAACSTVRRREAEAHHRATSKRHESSNGQRGIGSAAPPARKKLDDHRREPHESRRQNATEGAALTKDLRPARHVMLPSLGCTRLRCLPLPGQQRRRARVQAGAAEAQVSRSPALRRAGKPDTPKKEKGGQRTVSMAARPGAAGDRRATCAA